MIGVLYKKEKYLSLNIINNDIICALKKEYEVMSYKLLDNIEIDRLNIEKLYEKSSCVINLSSKCIDYMRNIYKPTIFLWHARMDHWGWINLYHNKRFFFENDVITFASQSALKKYKYIYTKWIKSFLLPYFTTIDVSKIPLDEKKIRKFYKIPLKKKIIVYFGRLSSEKNIEKIIDIFNALDRQDTCLLLIWNFSDEKTYGFWNQERIWDTYREYLLHLIATKKWSIILLTDIKRVVLLKILSFCYVYINMSKCYEEDFGISVIEAMKLWLPTICTDRWGIKDLVLHNKTGFLVKTGFGNQYMIKFKNKGIVAYINKILDDSILYEEISFEAYKRANLLYWEQAFIKNIKRIITYCNKYIKRKQKTLIPKVWIKKIYDKVIKEKKINEIYLNNLDFYKKIYRFYISK